MITTVCCQSLFVDFTVNWLAMYIEAEDLAVLDNEQTLTGLAHSPLLG